MAEIYNLNKGVDISQLCKDNDLTAKQTKEVEKAASGGFTADELKKLEESNIDVSFIKENATKKADKKKEMSASDVADKAEEVAEKYTKGLAKASGDIYTSGNPQLTALEKAMDDGLITDLAEEGFTKSQIIEIIEKSFDNIGIQKTNSSEGSYNRPHGHDEKAREIYSRFSSELVAATGEGSEELKAAREKLTKINNQILSNNSSMSNLQVSIDMLKEDIQENIEKAIDESKEIAEDQKEKSKEKVNDWLNKYSYSEGNMSYEEFKAGLAGDLDAIEGTGERKLSSVIMAMVDTERQMATMKDYISELGSLIDENESLEVDAVETEKEIKDEIKKIAESGTCDPDATCTDPIGFTQDNVRYDFFVDKDDDGNVTNEKEFLGAKDGFKEVKALDTNNDGYVNASELKAGNVKLIRTSEDGTQTVLNASEVFTTEDSISLKSYNATNKDIGEGNKLIGTFDVNMGHQKLDGYQTLDTNEWLDDNYEFSDEINGVGRFAQDADTAVKSEDFTNVHTDAINTQATLETELQNTWNKIGFNRNEFTNFINSKSSEAAKKAENIENIFTKTASQQEADVEAKLEEELENEMEEE